MFYKSIDQTKETQLRVDLESRKHHDTLLPSQKSPLPHNRYEEDSNGNSTIFLNAGKKPADCKMVAKALFSFQAQNSRELSFRKGDVIYIKKQVDNNWYEGERNASVGIFPVTYVEILPNNPEVSTLSKKEKSNDGQAKARFNFTAQTPMELSLIKGEMITLTRRIDKNWYEGRIGSRKGILPVAYVDVLSDPGSGDGGTNSGLSTLLRNLRRPQRLTPSSRTAPWRRAPTSRSTRSRSQSWARALPVPTPHSPETSPDPDPPCPTENPSQHHSEPFITTNL